MRLSAIRNLYGGTGPWASVYLDATGTQMSGTPQEARNELDLRWRAARESLERDGADEATLRAIDDAVASAPSTVGPAEIAVLAAHGEVALRFTLPVRPGREAATWSAQPHAADLVRAISSPAVAGQPDLGEFQEVRWVVADVDRTGGSITRDDGVTETVRGEDEFVTKVATAGQDRPWSDARDQRAVEENWGQNSAAVAEAIDRAVSRIGADLVVLAGDVRARQLVIERLPATVASCVYPVDHEVPVRPHPESRLRDRREPDVYDPAIVAAARTAVESVAAGRRKDILDQFHSGLSHGHSVWGLGPVCAAARELAIDTLLLSAEPSHRQAWVDPLNPSMVGESKEDTGTSAAVAESADDAVVGAAAIGSSESLVIEADIELVDGIGAILRYPDERAPRFARSGSHERRTGGPVAG